MSFETNTDIKLESYRTKKIESIPLLEKPDSMFVGWYTNSSFAGEAITFPYEVKKDITLYAKWNQKFIVEFESNGGSEIASYKTAEILTLPDITREGYFFAGWYEQSDFGGEAVTVPYQVTKETTFYAKWLKIYTVSFETNDGTRINPIQTAIINSAPVTRKDGNIFIGWYKESALVNQVMFPYQVNSDITLYAGWVDASNSIYTVKHYQQDTSRNSYTFIEYETKYGIAGEQTIAMSKNYPGFTAIPFTQKIISDDNCTTVEIYYDRNIYTLTFNSNGGSGIIENKNFWYGVNTQLPDNTFEKRGYVFAGWSKTETGSIDYENEDYYAIENNSTLYAVWEPVSYSINYVLNNGKNSELNIFSYTIEDEVILSNPIREGYIFLGWYTDSSFSESSITKITAGTTGNKTFYARWEIIVYSIIYILNEGTVSVPNPETYTIVTSTFALNSPVKTGYTFAGWYDNPDFNGSSYNQISKGSYGDKVLYAKWTVKSYTITYNLNGGKNNSNNPRTYTIESDLIILQNPTRGGCIFRGWYTSSSYSGNMVTKIESGSTGNKVYFAKWELVQYTIGYNLNGGSFTTSYPETYNVTTATFYLPTPVRTGYTFAGWYANSSFSGNKSIQIVNGSFGNKTFYAKWTPTVYTIMYELDEGINNSQNPDSYTIESSTILLENPSRTGYIFQGWYLDSSFSGSQVIEIESGSTGNKTIYAKWEIITCSITYNLNEGENSSANLNTFTIKDIPLVLKPAVRKNYSFLGWYSSADFNGEPVSQIFDIDNETVTLYAKWIYGCVVTAKTVNTFDASSVDTVVVSGEIAVQGLRTLALRLNKFSSVTTLDLSKAEDLSTLECIYISETNGSRKVSFLDGCSNITNVILPENLTEIGEYAFRDCRTLESIIIPSSVKNIGESAFVYCTGLKEINLPERLESVSDFAFYNCFGLERLTIPSSLTTLGRNAFGNCRSLTSILIKPGLTRIGNQAFYYCDSLKSIEIPDTVVTIGENAFGHCMQLTTINIPDSVKEIEKNAFYDCDSLVSIVIPDTVETMGDSVFASCDNLVSVVLSDSVSSLNGSFFAYCKNLQFVVIPENISEIGKGVFGMCTSLSEINYKGTKSQWNAISKSRDHLNIENWMGTGAGIIKVICSDGEIEL